MQVIKDTFDEFDSSVLQGNEEAVIQCKSNRLRQFDLILV